MRALLFHSGLPIQFWTDTLLTSIYLINRLPSSAINNISPFQKLYHKPPQYNLLHPFGCLCYPHTHPTSPHKLHPRSTPCIFLGYSETSKGFKCYDSHSKKIILSRHVIFYETHMPYKSSSASTSHHLTSENGPSSRSPLLLVPSHITHKINSPFHTQFPQRQTVTSSSNLNPEPQIPNSPTSSNPSSPTIHPTLPTSTPTRQHPMVTRTQTGSLKPKATFDLLHFTTASDEPRSHITALADPHWSAAMNEEFRALLSQNTWTLVPCPPNTNILGCKRMFKKKYNADGSLARYKARLVA